MNDEAELASLAVALRTLFVSAGMPKEHAAWTHASRARLPDRREFPVQRWLDAVLDGAPAHTHAAAVAFMAVAHRLQWGQTYTAGDFLDNYAWAELIGARGPLASDTQAIGFLLLGPRTFYPPHAHPAQEYYVPLSGVASWYADGAGWQTVTPGSLVHHAPNIAHAMQTGVEPLLAAYCWTGEIQTSASMVER